MMKQAIYKACKYFSINQTLFEYAQKFYVPALNNFKNLTKNNYTLLRQIIKEKNTILEKWNNIKILNIYDNLTQRDLFEEDKLEVTVEVELADLSPNSIEVQIIFINEIYCVLAPGLEDEIQRQLEIFSVPFKEYKDNKAIFYGVYPLYGHGLKQYSIRIVPKNNFIKKAYPNLIKLKN